MIGALLLLAGCAPSVEDQLEEVRTLQANNEMEKSIPILIELIESGNRQGEILYRYGRALSLTGKPERSVWSLDAARDDPEWFVRASQQLAIDAHRGGNYTFAMEVFDRLHAEAPEEGKDDLYALLLEARVLLDSQDHFEEALEVIDQIIERFPEEETAVRMKAVALLGLKRPDEAYELLHASGIAPAEPGSDETGKKARKKDGMDAAATVAAADAEDAADSEAADEQGEDPDLYLELEDESREAYWCAVRASFKREAGEKEEASKIADACLEKFPSSTDLLSEAMKLYSDMGRFDRVLEILEKAHDESPDNPEIRGALVQYLGRIGRTKEVEKILRQAVDEAVAAGPAAAQEAAGRWIELAGFLMDQNRIGEALVAFDETNKLVGDNASPDLLMREAEALIRAKEYDEALAMAAKTPVEVHALMLRGRIAFERGNYQEALDELGQAALQWPDNAPIRYYRARAAESLGQFDLAIEEYRQAIRSDSTLAAARERLARLHLAEGNVREAAAILTFQSPRKPSTPSAAMRILMVEVEARRGTEPDLEIPPTPEYPTERVRAETIRSLGRGLTLRTNAKVAAGVLAELEKQSVAPIRGAFLRERVQLLLAAGEIENAIAEAKAGVKARPKDPDSELALGLALAKNGAEQDEADRLLKGFLEKRPEDVDALVGLADLELRRNRTAAADELYERALRVAPDRWEAFGARIGNLFRAGKSDEALQRLERFVSTDAPYEGRGALELARRLPADESSRDRRIELTHRAIRFSAGQEALDWLAELDPAAAAEYDSKPVVGRRREPGAEAGAPSAEGETAASAAATPQARPAAGDATAEKSPRAKAEAKAGATSADGAGSAN